MRAVEIAYLGENHPLIAVSYCESKFQQYDNGTVLKNKNSSASGAFQILKSAHQEEALAHGWDINTFSGNLFYAKYLYDNEGLKPWKQSAHCQKTYKPILDG